MLNFIPNIGSIIAAVPAILLALIQQCWPCALLTLLGYMVVNITIGNFLELRVMGRSLGLSTLVVFLSLLFWGWVLGPIGIVLSVPLTMIVKIALAANEENREPGIIRKELPVCITYYLISDLHIGGDEALGVCDYEEELISYLEKLETQQEEAELFIIGDIFGLWEFTDIEGLEKLNKLIEQFPRIFQALQRAGETIKITMLPGNHDYKIFCYPGFVEMLRPYNIHLGADSSHNPGNQRQENLDRARQPA